jgi:hypothetical protein
MRLFARWAIVLAVGSYHAGENPMNISDELRQHAVRARLLAAGTPDQAARRRALADELDERALQLEDPSLNTVTTYVALAQQTVAELQIREAEHPPLGVILLWCALAKCWGLLAAVGSRAATKVRTSVGSIGRGGRLDLVEQG